MMARDPALTENFFSLSSINNDKYENIQATINLLIKEKLYSYLPNVEPIYAYNLALLKEEAKLQNELSVTIGKIKQWADEQSLPDTVSLVAFKEKLAMPSDAIVIMYGAGKKNLETVAVLITETAINLEQRKQIVINMLADKELTKCITGCYSRISSAAEQLIESFEGPHQTRSWVQSYINTEARQLAAKTAFPMPVTYQALVCKASGCSEESNMLHANNYLLMKAKERGLPVTVARDTGAIAFDTTINTNDKAIINTYISYLEKTLNANNLVTSISEKLHRDIQYLLSRDLNYADKINMIINKLNLLGEDNFYPGEILSEDGHLKSPDYIKITVTERLSKKEPLTITHHLPNMGLLEKAEIHTILSPEDGKTLKFHRFPSLALSWFQKDDERKPFLPFIKENGLSHFMAWEPLQQQPDGDDSILVLHNFLIKSTKDLLLIIDHLPKEKSFLNWISLKQIVSFVKQDATPEQFVDIFKNILFIPNRSQANKFLRECGNVFVHNMLRDGIFQSSVDIAFPQLSFTYTAKDYSVNVKQTVLKLTKELLQLITISNFRNFNGFVFYKIEYLDYLNQISFNHADLKQAQFFQPINNCKFDFADLRGTKFHHNLNTLSLQTDLREVTFPITNAEVTALNLRGAQLSTTSFAQLRNLDITDFSSTDLREVNFQHATIKSRLQYLNFNEANLESVDLNNLNLQSTWFIKTNLAKANLVRTELSFDNKFDQQTNLAHSQLTLSTLYSLYQKLGIKHFDHCTIVIDDVSMAIDLRFEKASLQGATFIGKKLKGIFIESDLTDTTFSPSTSATSDQIQTSTLRLEAKFKNSLLNKAKFNHVRFLRDNHFSDSSVQAIVFNAVEMSASLLFYFYEQGHRNFQGIHELKEGILSNKLPPLPPLPPFPIIQ
ncbi:pentapeptide repeat-containing protein [Candidatus Rickettsiella viridis]|nr:pentapeptide repeat-containing protein [Candidatus Rickettsiella viridis]